MEKKLICFLICLSLMFIILSGCTNSIKDSSKSNESEISETSSSINDTATDETDFNKHSSLSTLGGVIGLFDEKNNVYSGAPINLENSKDFKVVVNTKYFVAPAPNEDLDYAITAYIDYKQVDFSIGNDKTKVKRYTSKAKSDSEIYTTLTLPTSSLSGSHKLTIISQLIKYPGENLPDSWCKTLDLNIGNESSYVANAKKSTGKDITCSLGVSERELIVNRNFSVESATSKGMSRTSRVIKSKRNSNLSLALRFPKVSNDGILFLTINNEQVPIGDQQYLYFSGMKNPMFKKVNIKTPDKAGEYILTGYFVHNPWEKASDLTAVSESIKLIVE